MGRKSAKIANKKGAADKARGQVFTKALKDVFLASKNGGPDTSTNFLLRVAVERCRKFNVPKNNIDKAIKKGQGSDGVGHQEINYEGYAAHGVALFIEASTDNVTRTIANIRTYFKKCQGSLGVAGSLEFTFEHKCLFLIPLMELEEDDFTMAMIDAGADDVNIQEDFYQVIGTKDTFGPIQEKLQEISVTPEEASLVRFPLNTKSIPSENQEDIEKLIHLLEEDEDVLVVYHNMEIAPS